MRLYDRIIATFGLIFKGECCDNMICRSNRRMQFIYRPMFKKGRQAREMITGEMEVDI